jgi:hypothetical protein
MSRERDAVLEILQDQTVKILDAERLDRRSTRERLLAQRLRTIKHGLAAGLTPDQMIEITHQEG